MRLKRSVTAMLMAVMLSFGTVFAAAEQVQADSQQGQESVQNQTQTEATTQTETATAAQTETAAQTQESRVFKKGKYYYYRKQNGSIRKKAGFVRDGDKLYYVRKGGKIMTGKTFKVGKKKYRAFKNGVIAVGVYRWEKKWYFSDQNGRWIKKECVVSWNDSLYYLNKNGIVAMNAAVAFKNVPYLADESGRLTMLEIPDAGDNPVAAVAKSQVGVMTGKTYWKWYFHSKFINTDKTPWCGTFVAWCYNQAGMYDRLSGVTSYGNLGYVPSYSRYANKKNKWVNRADAQPGDVVVFGKNRHVGIIEGISGGCLITIEGNTGPTAAFGCGKAGAVCRKAYKLDDKDIKGILRP